MTVAHTEHASSFDELDDHGKEFELLMVIPVQPVAGIKKAEKQRTPLFLIS